MKRDMYQEVTDRILESLRCGVAPWVQPWDGYGLPVNGTTKRPYNGVNVLLLMGETWARGYESNEWMTFKQARDKGAHVRKGQKGTRIVFWKFLEVNHDTDEEISTKTRTIPMAKAYTVFNRDQIDGLPEPERQENLTEEDKIRQAEQFVRQTGARIEHRGEMAAYFPKRDVIAMPELARFHHAAGYYSTLLHELTHWTGAENRLDRDLSGRFGSGSYAMEEMVAELGSAFLCGHLGIQGHLQHAEYIGSWVRKLEEDNRAIFTASSAAQGAVAFLKDQNEEGVAAA